MSRPATSRLKVNPPLGHLPALQYLLPAQLSIDPTYQRSLDAAPSQALIRRIAQHWNWDLCQPLVVARRDDGALYVIDGQHRLEAARMRGDISQLPAVVVQYASQADEAASFVHLNQQRRPLTKLDVFKAAVASGDPQSMEIRQAMADAGLSLASTTNADFWKPGQLVNIGGIERAWQRQGPDAAQAALKVMARAFSGQVLRYAGTIFPGIAMVVSDELRSKSEHGRAPKLIAMLASKNQTEWRGVIYAAHAKATNLSRREAAESALRLAWADWQQSQSAPPVPALPRHVPPPQRAVAPPRVVLPPEPPLPVRRVSTLFDAEGKTFCEQCDKRVARAWAKACIAKFCKVKAAA